MYNTFVNADKKRFVKANGQIFSLGAMALALAACSSSDFELDEDNGVAVDGNDVKLTFTEAPDSVSTTTGDYTVTGASLSKVASSGSAITFTFDKAADSITIKAADGKEPIKDDSGDNFTFTYTFDTKAPEAQGAEEGTDAKTVVVTFHENVANAVAANFKIGSAAATGATVDGKKVTLTFADDVAADAEITIAAGAVEDIVTGKANTTANKNAEGKVTVGAGDTTPPELASTTDALSVDADKKVLTVTFNETITDKDDTKITVKKDGTALTTANTIAIDGSTITITYTAALEAGDYKVEFATDAVTSAGGATTGALTTEEDTVSASIEDDLVGISSDADYGVM